MIHLHQINFETILENQYEIVLSSHIEFLTSYLQRTANLCNSMEKTLYELFATYTSS